MVFWKSKHPPQPNHETILPELNANIFSKISFWWIGDLMKLGYKRPLEKKDLYILNDARLSKNLVDQFEIEWKKELAKIGTIKKPSLLRALNRMVGRKFWYGGVCRIISDVLLVTSPLILKEILSFVAQAYFSNITQKDPPQAYYGYILAVVLFLMQITSTILNNIYFYNCMEVGILVRTTLIGTIYRKALVLSGKARNSFTTGKVTNLMSTDTSRLDIVSGYFHIAWSVPIIITIALALLILNIGPSALAGFGLLIIMGPLQGKVMKSLANARKKAAKFTDERVKLTQEILQGIRVIKYYAWEESFLGTLNKLRIREVGYIRFLLVIRSGIIGFSLVIPVFASILSFVVYSLVGGQLTASVVFSSLALFNIIRLPLMFLPMVIASIVDAAVSVERIEELLVADELESLPRINRNGDFAIKVDDGEFVWEGAPPEEVVKSKNDRKKNKKDKKNKKNKKNMKDKDEKNPVNNKQDEIPEIPADPEELTANARSLTPQSHLSKINIEILRGLLVAIVGSVGSGKSSLLSAFVGEMRKVRGDIEFGGTVGYCPQTAWIQNATLKDNITFGLPFDKERYLQVIKDCCLEPDLAVLPMGDMTEIGEKGINLSGGQKQRINIARAVYHDADIVLLDDPLSAVDAHVGSYLFTNCIQGALAKKTRILVTHHLHVLSNVDYIICMEGGKIAEQGTYEELMNADKSFSKLIAEYGEAEEEEKIEVDEIVNDKKFYENVNVLGKGLMSQEERSTGAVDKTVYIAYIRAAGGLLLIPLLLFMLIMMQGTNIGNNLWLSYWSNNEESSKSKVQDPGAFAGYSTEFYIGVYCIWGALQGIFSVLCGILFSLSGVAAAKKLHNKAIERILRAPTSFFDTTPLGRIINRFSKDVDACDNLLSESYRMFFNTFTVVIGTFILIAVVYVWFLIPLVPLIFIYYYAALHYRPANRELKRLDSVLRSSLYAHFSETLTGLPSIRAYREQERFLRNNELFIDLENRAYFLTICIQRWIGIRLESTANLLVFCASLFSIIERFSVSPSIIGLALSYALQITSTFSWCVRQYAEVEANMNSVERLVHYSNDIEIEAEPIIPDNRPPAEWPSRGEVHVNDLVVQYGPDNPPVLKGVSFDIQPAEKIGIIGRTGCGKSTLATSFFRFVEPTSGSIILDGINISTIGLKDLRTKITIIPQDPILFNGTLRSNLDPFNEHTDLDLWNALRRAHLVHESQPPSSDLPKLDPEKEKGTDGLLITLEDQSQKQELTLDTPVTVHGGNFSQGQQQLIALARAVVRRSKLIIMDEATASVDFKTDHLIQVTIREEFSNSTVITIAHRLRTVADYDKILVMDAGNIIEYDTPYQLMQNPDSVFRGMCEQSGEFTELSDIARQKHENNNNNMNTF